MPAAPTRAVEGTITIVQEHRFCLMTEGGQGLLFTLAHDAGLEQPALQRLSLSRTPVRVTYEGEPTLESGVAHAVQPLHRPTTRTHPETTVEERLHAATR